MHPDLNEVLRRQAQQYMTQQPEGEHHHTWTYVASEKHILRACTICSVSFVLSEDVALTYRWKQVSEPSHID